MWVLWLICTARARLSDHCLLSSSLTDRYRYGKWQPGPSCEWWRTLATMNIRSCYTVQMGDVKRCAYIMCSKGWGGGRWSAEATAQPINFKNASKKLLCMHSTETQNQLRYSTLQSVNTGKVYISRSIENEYSHKKEKSRTRSFHYLNYFP